MMIRPEDFYKIRFSDLWLMWKGYNDKLGYEHDLIRTQTAILYHPLCATIKNPRRFDVLWPDRNKSNKDSRATLAQRAWKRHKEEQALEKLKEKNGYNI